MTNNDFYINNLSYSQLRTFITNSGEWQNNRLLGIYDNTTSVSAAVGTMLHKFVETYINIGDIDHAYKTALSMIYDSSDGNTYIIDPSVVDSPHEVIMDDFKTRKIDFGKTGSNQKILKDVKAGIKAFMSEDIDFGSNENIFTELDLEYEVSEKIDKYVFKSPIPFKAILDLTTRLDQPKNILVDGELQEVPKGSLVIYDWKFKAKHTEMNAEDPKYIFQAMFYYYTAREHFGEAPVYIEFYEIKTSTNKDGSSQHQKVLIPFFGDTFEEYKVYFWRYLVESFERIKILQERDFLFNIFDMFNGDKEWQKQKAYYLGVPVGQLKSKIAINSKNRKASNMPMMGDRDPLKKYKSTKSEIEKEDLTTIDNKIRVAFQNFGVPVKFEKKIEGYSFDQYLFKLARGITMSRVKSLEPELIQALEVEKGLRIEAPVLGTKFIGIEIPREERKFRELKVPKKAKRPVLPIGININGKKRSIDLSDPDTSHLLIGGQSGSGKSEFIKSTIVSLEKYGDIEIIDPKRVGLIKVKKYAKNYMTEVESVDLYLSSLNQIMDQLYEILANAGYESIYEAKEKENNFDHIKEKFIFIDELATLTNAKQQIVDDKGNLKEYDIGKAIMAKIGRIANLGRAVGYHLIIATQRPSVKVIPGDIKANISCRVSFALATSTDSKVVIDQEGAENLLGKGDMLFMNRGLERLQGYYIK